MNRNRSSGFESNQVQGNFQKYALGPAIEGITIYDGYVVAIGTPVVQSGFFLPYVAVAQKAIVYDCQTNGASELVAQVIKDYSVDDNGFRRAGGLESNAAAFLAAEEGKREARRMLNNQIDEKIGLQRFVR